MKKALYRLFRRKGVFYYEDTHSGKQLSCKTRDKAEALRILAALGDAQVQRKSTNYRLAQVYLAASDPKFATRTWQDAFAAIIPTKTGPTRDRWERAVKDQAFDLLRDKVIIETDGQDLLDVLKAGSVSTNVYLRRVYNFTLDLGWLPRAILPKRQWPKVRYKKKRAITPEEHQRIIARELNPERNLYYQLVWETGASQSDLAMLSNTHVNRTERSIVFGRQKLEDREEGDESPAPCRLHFDPGSRLEKILDQLPRQAPLFPYLSSVRANDRATEFGQRCKGLAIQGVSLQSYRYSWAQRAKKAGYPQRFAEAWLGHNSKAVHAAYAKGAEMVFLSLEQWQKHFPTPEVLHVDFKPVHCPTTACAGLSPIGDSPGADPGKATA